MLRGDEWIDAHLLAVLGLGRGPVICWADGETAAYNLACNVRLDTRRREVQHLLCDHYRLPDWQRSSPRADALAWFAGVTGRKVRAIESAPRDVNARSALRNFAGRSLWWTATDADRDYFIASYMPKDHVGWGWYVGHAISSSVTVFGMETGAVASEAINRAALADAVALLTPAGLLLPPVVVGGEPVLWPFPAPSGSSADKE